MKSLDRKHRRAIDTRASPPGCQSMPSSRGTFLANAPKTRFEAVVRDGSTRASFADSTLPAHPMHRKEGNTMQNPYERHLGRIKAAVWKNEGNNGKTPSWAENRSSLPGL